jgi:predicted nucleic acid-binding protein
MPLIISATRVRTGASTDPGGEHLGLPLDIIPADQTLAEIAGEIKASRSMSLTDCFAAALARQRRAELYTGDPEFR